MDPIGEALAVVVGRPWSVPVRNVIHDLLANKWYEVTFAGSNATTHSSTCRTRLQGNGDAEISASCAWAVGLGRPGSRDGSARRLRLPMHALDAEIKTLNDAPTASAAQKYRAVQVQSEALVGDP